MSKITPEQMVGQRFARLSVVSEAPERGHDFWRCACDCGATSIVKGTKLRSGHTRSCGCFHRERAVEAGQAKRTHGGSGGSGEGKHPLYGTWTGMRARCNNPRHRAYVWYGGRGIYVCDRWSGKDGFAHFIEDMGERPSGASIDRIDNDGPYAPGNCRWASPAEQRSNERNGRWLRPKTHCKHGHEFTPENTRVTRDGFRACRACARDAYYRQKARRAV